MPFFQKKPVVIEARQLTNNNAPEIFDWISSNSIERCSISQPLVIRTLEGEHEATLGDWIIKDAKGEFYACKPDIFEITYQPMIKNND